MVLLCDRRHKKRHLSQFFVMNGVEYYLLLDYMDDK